MAINNKHRVEALAYYRTSSAANVGQDKDSDKRQKSAIASYAKRAGFQIVEEFYDAAVSGANPIQDRPGFAALLDRIEGNGVRTVIIVGLAALVEEAQHRKFFTDLSQATTFAGRRACTSQTLALRHHFRPQLLVALAPFTLATFLALALACVPQLVD